MIEIVGEADVDVVLAFGEHVQLSVGNVLVEPVRMERGDDGVLTWATHGTHGLEVRDTVQPGLAAACTV